MTTPGWKTSEFYLKLLATLLTALFASGVIPTSGVISQVVAIVATMLGAIGYTVSRTQLKGKAFDLDTTLPPLAAVALATVVPVPVIPVIPVDPVAPVQAVSVPVSVPVEPMPTPPVTSSVDALITP